MVGIGASAGGYEAFKALLKYLPSHTGMAFVLVQHLDPAHKSQLADLLSRATSLPVIEARNGMAVEPDQVYVLGPNASMEIKGGVLHVSRRKAAARNLPVDLFFCSLAEERGRKAVGVILSGTGSDGVEGVKAIRDAGGITYAQDVKTAKHGGMPRAAADTQCMDAVLSPAAIARELVGLGSQPYFKKDRAPATMDEREITVLFSIVLGRTGVDFTQYKRATVQRRIRRRMALHRISSLRKYTQLLQKKPEEVDALYEDVLINVTYFFRDKATFRALKKQVFPQLLRDRAADEPIRIWVPGCATGEEVYSLAIEVLEHVEDDSSPPPVQLFGTDISEQALEKARAGVYAKGIEKDLTRARLRRYFTHAPEGYQVRPFLRELCFFDSLDMLKDPPFLSMDLVSCRNVLIYLGPQLQQRLLPIFHYAMKPTGFLLLGKAETIDPFTNLFAAADKSHRIYKPKPMAAMPRPFAARPGAAGPSSDHGARTATERDAGKSDEQNAVKPVEGKLAATHAAQRQMAEEQSTANEELRVLNEELQSRNEELECTNEELRTSQEELQSVNEELSSLNSEFEARGVELGKAYDDLVNVLESTQLPLVILDAELQVRRFTPMAESVLNLHASDLGRPIGELRLPLKTAALKRMLTDTLRAPGLEKCEVQDRQGHWCELQTRPYYTTDNRVDGVLVILRDIDAAKRALLQVEAERDRAEAITEAVQTPLLVLDKDLRIRHANPAFYHTFQMTREATEGSLFCELGKRNWPPEKVRKPLKRMLRDGTSMDKVEVEYEFFAIGRRTVQLSARRISDGKRETSLLMLAMEDVTERRQMEKEILHTAESERERIGRELHDGLGQVLPSIGYLLRAAQQALERKDAPEAEQVKKAARLAEEYAKTTHDIARGLFPMEIEKGGIVAALRELATYSEDLHGLTCRVSGLTDIDLTAAEVVRHVYRIAQESVNNAARHSRATTIWIRLARRKKDHILMTIRDNGRGMPREKGRQSGMGLRLMQYRADLIGATLKIESTQDKGTKISCLIPPRDTLEKENDA